MEPTAPPNWLVVLGPDGVVLAVSGGAPGAWVGQRLAALADAPATARAAADGLLAALVSAARGSAVERAVVPGDDGAPTIELVALEAIGLRRAPVDLAALLTTSLEAVTRQADALEISLTVECPGALPGQVAVDPEKIGWAVATLAGNALRHVRRGTRSRPGGSIRVLARHDPARHEVAIAVADDGPGIPAEQQRWLFARKPGTAHAVGLGLMLVHDVAIAHGGVVEVRSTTEGLDHGTTITLRLPAR